MYEKVRKFEYVGEIIINNGAETLFVEATQEYCKPVVVNVTEIQSSKKYEKKFETIFDFFKWLNELP